MMKMLRLISMPAMLAVAGFAMPAAAQKVAPVSIAVLDFAVINNDSLVAKSAQAQLKDWQDKTQASIKSKGQALQTEEQSLTKERDDLEKQQGVVTQDAFKTKADAFQAKVQAHMKKREDFDKSMQDKQRAFGVANQKVAESINKALEPILQSVMDQRGVTIILDKRSIAVNKNAQGLDVTADVVAQLNKALPTIKVELPQ